MASLTSIKSVFSYISALFSILILVTQDLEMLENLFVERSGGLVDIALAQLKVSFSLLSLLGKTTTNCLFSPQIIN